MFNIERFKSKITNIARPDLFEVVIYGSNQQKMDEEMFRFTCNASSLPVDSTTDIPVNFYGRTIHYAGSRTYGTWTTTIFSDNDWKVYRQLYEWKQKMNSSAENVATTAKMNEFKCDASIFLYDVTGENSKRLAMKLIGCYPTELGNVDLNWQAASTPASYTVTWTYDYHILQK